MQSQRLLRLADQFRQVGLVADGQAPFGQDDLRGALDRLLRAPHGQSRVVGDRALDAIELLPERAGVFQPGQRIRGQLRPGRRDVASLRTHYQPG